MDTRGVSFQVGYITILEVMCLETERCASITRSSECHTRQGDPRAEVPVIIHA